MDLPSFVHAAVISKDNFLKPWASSFLCTFKLAFNQSQSSSAVNITDLYCDWFKYEKKVGIAVEPLCYDTTMVTQEKKVDLHGLSLQYILFF